ncbi:MAG: hypothetical protein JO154_14660 [Chitinophaga sp.]|uniref:hypothetical protein n=1 Tax=Chitinophaga sp. TaxID=1869181 RepID=UPI0025BEBA3D|nr:hypothetical protein [Chitinophaga sp.]MBV8253842.1 hypothetical protein [Chitinophaga sp.]
MLILHLLIIFFQLIYGDVKAFAVQLTAYGRFWGGAAYGSGFTDALVAADNPAVLADCRHFNAGIFTERRFGLAEVPMYLAALVIPAGGTALGVQLRQFGNSYWKEQALSGSMGLHLGEGLGVGAQLGYHSKSVYQYGSKGVPSAVLAVRWRPGPGWMAGVQVIREDDWQYRLGVGWQSGQGFLLAAEYRQQEGKLSPAIQAIYRIIPVLAMELGLSGWPPAPQWVVMLTRGLLRIDGGASIHPQLGFTPTIALIWGK